jgi:hypothetical protein
MITLLLLSSLAFADVPHVTCPLDGKIYDGAAACPGTCLPVPDGVNVRIVKCQAGSLVNDNSKKASYDKKVKDERDAKDARKAKIDALKASTNPEIRDLIELIKDKE